MATAGDMPCKRRERMMKRLLCSLMVAFGIYPAQAQIKILDGSLEIMIKRNAE